MDNEGPYGVVSSPLTENDTAEMRRSVTAARGFERSVSGGGRGSGGNDGGRRMNLVNIRVDFAAKIEFG